MSSAAKGPTLTRPALRAEKGTPASRMDVGPLDQARRSSWPAAVMVPLSAQRGG